ncbi:MAG: penicillin-binding protein 2 [Bacteroidales bacterium]|nr:penicillin-binding protein 2 [Bacteroidales bacterium]
MDRFSYRKVVLIAVILAVFAVIVGKLFYIQIIDRKYRVNAENNALKYETRYPARGLIRDRDGRIIVGNKISYDIMVTPAVIKEPFDTVAFCRIFDVDTAFVKARFREWRLYRSKIGHQPQVLLKQVPARQYSVFAEQMEQFPGFDGIPRTARTYNYHAGGNLLGYISEVDADYIKKNPEYRSGDYAGKTGMEEAFEQTLRGEKGYAIYYRDVHNRIVDRYEEGLYDKPAVAGTDIYTTIDAPLQAFGEKLMQNKVGSLVAIEPSSGDILAMVSSPGIDVSYLAEINKYYSQLVTDPYRPMFNRAVQSPQPPGSVFKLVNALIGLQEGVIQPETRFPCQRGYRVGRLTVGCHAHPSPLDLKQAIMMSCNAYFCHTFRAIIDNPKYGSVREGFEAWSDYVRSFGIGSKLGTDIPGELGGMMPTAERYDRIHGKNAWKSLSIVSLSIGQGELGITPLHLANLAATIANRGYYYIPHIQKDRPECPIDGRFRERHYTPFDSLHYETVIDGMRLAVNGGAGATARIARIPGVIVCGKTGTAENPHGDEHSVFICFAPAENPQIAVAAYIENAGFGATWAAPIASLLVEQYLHDGIAPERKWLENRIESANLLHKVRVKR